MIGELLAQHANANVPIGSTKKANKVKGTFVTGKD